MITIVFIFNRLVCLDGLGFISSRSLVGTHFA